MNGSSVLLYVGAPTLVAAIITLSAFQITATRIERKRRRRPRTLEGPVPGHQSLSSIGLNRPAATDTRNTSSLQGQPDSARQQTLPDAKQEPQPNRWAVQPSPQPVKDAQLNSLQTIRARSAALHTESQPTKSSGPKPLMPTYAPSVDRPGTHTLPVREQDSATPHEAGNSDQPEDATPTPSNAGQTADSTRPEIIQKTTTSKRAKRANTQAEQIKTSLPGSDQTPADVLANPGSLDLLDTLQSSPVGDLTGQENSTLDIFAGLSETEVGVDALTDDLKDIDGGGLPTAASKTPQKSKR